MRVTGGPAPGAPRAVRQPRRPFRSWPILGAAAEAVSAQPPGAAHAVVPVGAARTWPVAAWVGRAAPVAQRRRATFPAH